MNTDVVARDGLVIETNAAIALKEAADRRYEAYYRADTEKKQALVPKKKRPQPLELTIDEIGDFIDGYKADFIMNVDFSGLAEPDEGSSDVDE